MKKLTFIFTFASLLWLTAGVHAEPVHPSEPTRYVLGLSPYLDRSAKDDVYRKIIRFVVQDLPLGSSVSIYDAYNLKTITSLEIPGLAAFASPKTRANQFKEQIFKLKQFLASEAVNELTNANHEPVIRLPQFLDFIAANRTSTKDPLVVMLLGSPLYIDGKEPAFSMAEGYFPSDGHLMVSREKSIFGLKERKGALANTIVHFGYFGDPWVTQLHAEKVQRFWTLYLEGQGARLETFCADLPTIFNAARTRNTILVQSFPALDQSKGKIEMLRISRDVAQSDWITRDVLVNPHQSPPLKHIGPMKIGIRWKGDIDLDLYAKARLGSETLFFEHPRAREGYYFKDYRSSPDGEYEYIEFESPVDVTEVDARINYYKGNRPAPAGEIRIEFEGRVYSGKFDLAGSSGNEGRSGPSQRACWTTIDIQKILKLRNEQSAALR